MNNYLTWFTFIKNVFFCIKMILINIFVSKMITSISSRSRTAIQKMCCNGVSEKSGKTEKMKIGRIGLTTEPHNRVNDQNINAFFRYHGASWKWL